MDRQAVTAVTIASIVLFAWLYQSQRDAQHLQAVRQAAAAASATPSVVGKPSAIPSATPIARPKATAKAEPSVPESKQAVVTPLVEYSFTNLGGGIASATLLKHQGEKPGEKMVLNAFGNHPIGAVLTDPDDASDKAWTVTANDGQVVCEHSDPDGIRIVKTFTLPSKAGTTADDGYRVKLDVAFSNPGAGAVDQPTFYVFAGSAEPIHQTEMPTYTGFNWQRDGKATFIDVNWFNPGRTLGMETSAGHSIYNEAPGNVVWAGVKNQYFTSILIPEAPARGVWASRIAVKTDTKEVKGVQGALELPGFKLNPNETIHRLFSVYIGPKEYRRLAALGNGESAMMTFGWFKIISVFLLRVMNKINDWVGNYAWSIIILTFIVRGALWPVQNAATKSMKQMALLQPKMAELKEKYKDDQAKVSEEMMKLYKEYGVNPFSGCLPMFIQIPIFIGFYSMLGTAVELRNSHFLWVHDLSRPDTVFVLAGVPINILPLCMAGTMIWQMALSPKSGDPAQQKMMMFMPLLFIFMTYNFASALALYYTVQNILSIFQLYLTRNQTAPALQRLTAGNKGRGRKPGRR